MIETIKLFWDYNPDGEQRYYSKEGGEGGVIFDKMDFPDLFTWPDTLTLVIGEL